MDLQRLTTPDRITIGAAALLALASALPWFAIDVFGATSDLTGWQLGWFSGRIPVLIGLALAVHVLLAAFAEQVKLPDWPWVRVHLVGGIVAAALVGLRALVGYEVRGFDYRRSFGLVVALAAAAGLVVAGVLRQRAGTTHAG